jgi:predicted DNA-binding transcriptional regulator AlpA
MGRSATKVFDTPSSSHMTSMTGALVSSQVTSCLPTMVLAVHHLVGSAEIAQLLGVSRQRVQQLIASPDFPAPDAVLAMGKVWLRADVIAWARAHGRLGDG